MSSDAPMSGVLGGGAVTVEAYLDTLRRHYLDGYLGLGGAAVKVAVAGDHRIAERLTDALARLAEDAGCLHVRLSAESTRVQMIDELYLAMARTVDWDTLAASSVRTAYDAVAFPAPPGKELTVTSVASYHDIDSRELYRSVRRQLEHQLLGDTGIAPQMRRAMLRLAQMQLGAGDLDPDEHEAVLGWLRGELTRISAVRSALIHSRIGRHNARAMLASLGRLLLAAGRGGLVVTVDYRRLAESRRPPAAVREGNYYSRAAVLDAWETLRQLIDGIDELRGVLVVGIVSPTQMTDDSRGLPSYTALQLRVADEVRDRRRANPFAALIRLEVRLEAV
jgi:hypothetical protein